MAIITLDDVSKTYRLGEVDVQALRGISLSVEPGEFVALMGASGSGKSSLLNLIGCLDIASGGSYQLDGRTVAGKDHDAFAGLRAELLGFIFQNFNLIPVLTAVENVELPMLWHPRPAPEKERRARALALLHSVGLSEQAHRRPSAMSGGQQQRVAIARALANNPRIVLADEPTANLDSASADQVLDTMTSLWREKGVTFILATHDPRILARATRVVYVADGKASRGHMYDPETGVFVRSYFEARLQQEHAGSSRRANKTFLVLLRAPAGDIVRAAETVIRTMRPSDTAARVRREVLAVLFGDVAEGHVKTVYERLLSALRAQGLAPTLLELVVAPGSDALEALEQGITTISEGDR